MTNQVNIVSHILTCEQRGTLLGAFPPAYPDIFAFQLTWAYKVPQDYLFPTGEQDLLLDGYHIGEYADAATGWLLRKGAAGIVRERTRPDGKLIHITLSTRFGTPPLKGGNINPAAIRSLDRPILLNVRLAKRHATTLRPERVAA